MIPGVIFVYIHEVTTMNSLTLVLTLYLCMHIIIVTFVCLCVTARTC